MNRMIVTSILVLLYTTSLATTAFAEASFQFSMPGLQAPVDENVQGMRVVFLHGKNNNVSGFDLGFAAVAESVNQSGFSFNLGMSKITGSSSGCACSLLNLHEGEDSGLNGAFITIIKSAPNGVNSGFVNMTEGKSAVDFGGLSMSKESNTQVGFVTFTSKINNLQIGILNFAENGFFPMFPFFNYPKK